MAGGVQVVARAHRRDLLGEGLLWSAREGAVYWTDILAPALNRLSLADGRVDRWPMPDMIGWVLERRNAPGLVAGFRGGFAELSLEPVAVTPIADPEPDLPANRMNDAKADRWGRVWAGTMPIACDVPSGSLYRLDPDRSVSRVDTGLTIANGPAISPDDRWFYHTDTKLGIVYRHPFGEGGLGPREPFIEFEPGRGSPDGMTVDAEGFLWIALWGASRVARFDADGRPERSIALPASQITNVCFAGDALDRMFVTSAGDGVPHEKHGGALFEVDPGGVRGLAPHQYGG